MTVYILEQMSMFSHDRTDIGAP